MAKAAVKAVKAVKSKAQKLKGRYSEVDIKATGPMPTWEDQHSLSAEAHKKRWHQGVYFYYYHHTMKELRPFIVQVYKNTWTKAQMKLFNKVRDNLISPQLGAYCKMVTDGARWNEDSKAWAAKHIEKLFAAAADVADDEDAPKVEKKVINIQDRLQEIREETIGDIEVLEDEFIRTGKAPNVSIVSFLRNKNTPQQIIPYMIDFYAERLAFMMEVKEGKDAQLKEGYAHLKRKDVDAWIKWYNDIITDLDGYKRVKVAARKPRARKPQSPEKLTRKLKHMKEAPELGVASVSPKDIIGAQAIWVYNTKTRKLGRYVASNLDQVLSVKGSTILGWDPKQSVSKTLRKPKEQLKEFMGSGKVQLRTFLDKIKATEVKMNGRMNDYTILLRVDK